MDMNVRMDMIDQPPIWLNRDCLSCPSSVLRLPCISRSFFLNNSSLLLLPCIRRHVPFSEQLFLYVLCLHWIKRHIPCSANFQNFSFSNIAQHCKTYFIWPWLLHNMQRMKSHGFKANPTEEKHYFAHPVGFKGLRCFCPWTEVEVLMWPSSKPRLIDL